MKSNPHIGSSLDDFLDEENLLTQVNEIAIKRVIAWQLQQEIETKQCRASRVGNAHQYASDLDKQVSKISKNNFESY